MNTKSGQSPNAGTMPGSNLNQSTDMNPKPDLDLNSEAADTPARILIVDDDLHNRHLLEVMLGPEGFLLLSAANGEDALALVEKSPPDLILLDVMMPGMSGYQVAAKIKGNLATTNIPIIMVTALDDHNAKMLGLGAGAEEFLSKPVDRAELCVRVRNLLRLKAYGDYHDKYGKMLEGEIDSRTADLVESERLYRSTFDAAPIGIVHLGLDGEWLRFNQRLCDLLGYSRVELQKSAVQKHVRSELSEEEKESFRRMAEGTLDRFVVDEKRFGRQDGSYMWARVNTAVHRDADGQPQHFISVVEDITERKKLEENLLLAGRMNSIGTLAAGVAHEISSPLAFLIANLDFIGQELRSSSDQALTIPLRELTEVMDDAREGANQIRHIVRGLKRFSRADEERRVPIAIQSMLELAISMTSNQIRYRGRLVKDYGRTPYVEADEARLSQVFVNLILNAVHAIGEGRGADDNEIRIITSTDSEGRAVIEVRDTGSGIPEENRPRLFDPYAPGKPLGISTGLSLPICHGIVAAHGGELSFETVMGVGTTFRVVLPAARQEAVLLAERPVTTIETVRRGRILVVNHDAILTRTLSRILAPDHEVTTASNGREAMERFTNGEQFDVVFSDLLMPFMTGIELYERLVSINIAQAHKFIFISGGAYTPSTQAFLDRVPNQRIEKPFDATNIRGLVQSYIR